MLVGEIDVTGTGRPAPAIGPGWSCARRVLLAGADRRLGPIPAREIRGTVGCNLRGQSLPRRPRFSLSDCGLGFGRAPR